MWKLYREQMEAVVVRVFVAWKWKRKQFFQWTGGMCPKLPHCHATTAVKTMVVMDKTQ
jgi:hypothetical protein